MSSGNQEMEMGAMNKKLPGKQEKYVLKEKRCSKKSVSDENTNNWILKAIKKLCPFLNSVDKNETLNTTENDLDPAEIIEKIQVKYSKDAIENYKFKIQNMDKNTLEKEMKHLLNNKTKIQSDLRTVYQQKTAEINEKDKEIYELQRKFQLANQRSKQSFDELKKEIEFLAGKNRLRGDIVLALWTSYLETKEARDEIKKRVLEYSQNGDDDAAKTVIQQLNYYKSKFQNILNTETNCGNEKELFKKILEIFKQKVNGISRLATLKEEMDKISFENQVLKINNETSYLEMKHYKKIANVYYSDFVSLSELRNSE
ncbi:uncharacterized protein LOC111622671 isoform X2 [Centruroides sculpturatus]|uniref:uncharacterized protein LOC111622671 isoform X2 n=1 Tax=Centruroides sculpturatus TaxID=218467 RepID=UPI000C6DDB39|nr:uncharacterized protein LOC111622671 isoform X2 [Centruroides sculpturatus]